MRLLSVVLVAALMASPAAREAMCRCSREVTKQSCCCGEAHTGTCCCTKTGPGDRLARSCMCKEKPPRAHERAGPDLPALVAVSFVVAPASRPATAERATAPREAPAPFPGFRPPLLI